MRNDVLPNGVTQQGAAPLSSSPGGATALKSRSLSARIREITRTAWKFRWLYMLMTPSLLYFLIFRYGPLWNAQIAFKNYKPVLGVWKSPWAGLVNFETFVNSFYFDKLMINTVFFSGAKLILGLPIAVALAIALYETWFKRFRTLVQTTIYLPHFLSWVVLFGVMLMLLSPGQGLINVIIKQFGGEPVAFLTSQQWFRFIVIASDIWKETGWSTILYLAALLSISPELYEAAAVDGASHMQRIWNISLPGILPVIVLVTLLRLGNILDAGFNQIFVLYSVPVYSVGDIIDTWVYRQGILDFQFSLATAVGLFKGAIGLILLLVANQAAKRLAGQSLF